MNSWKERLQVFFIFGLLVVPTGLMLLGVGEKDKAEICADHFERIYRFAPSSDPGDRESQQVIVDQKLDDLMAAMLTASKKSSVNSDGQMLQSSEAKSLNWRRELALEYQQSNSYNEYRYALKLARCTGFDTRDREP